MMHPYNSNLDMYCNTARLVRIRVWTLRVAWLNLVGLVLGMISLPFAIANIGPQGAYIYGDARSLFTAIMTVEKLEMAVSIGFWCMLWFGVTWLISYLLALREDMARLAERRRKAVTQ